jgi:LPS-assembly lipoprotein
MWSPDRRSLLAMLALSGLGACGFSPAYGPSGPAQGLRGRIKADPPATRNHFEFVAAFEDSLGRSDEPEWRLSYQINVSVVNLAVTPEGSILRYNYVGRVSYQVRDIASGKVVTRGSANSFTASAATRSTIAAAASTTDATTRLMQILSDLVVTQLLATSAKWVTPAP